ncbi:hypothetical protein HB991_13380 [Yersinia mollaretii]|uniref:Uncharacterized protein n=1 Tax=Yersinia mollaretii TaxID=33060 RepID=A0AA44CMH6_YERMO|nr:hypothetical protein [Yersinia mollaretii]NIL23497.1 hypothetical protein [Yersinia mollaretii]
MDIQIIHLFGWVFLYAMMAGYILAFIDQSEGPERYFNKLLISLFWPLTLAAILSSYIAMKVIGGHTDD